MVFSIFLHAVKDHWGFLDGLAELSPLPLDRR